MRWTHGSTTSSEPDAAFLLTQPDLSLLDGDGQAAVLADLVALLDAGRSLQVRHERRQPAADTTGHSAEAVLARDLAATATVWSTQLVGADAADMLVIDEDGRGPARGVAGTADLRRARRRPVGAHLRDDTVAGADSGRVDRRAARRRRPDRAAPAAGANRRRGVALPPPCRHADLDGRGRRAGGPGRRPGHGAGDRRRRSAVGVGSGRHHDRVVGTAAAHRHRRRPRDPGRTDRAPAPGTRAVARRGTRRRVPAARRVRRDRDGRHAVGRAVADARRDRRRRDDPRTAWPDHTDLRRARGGGRGERRALRVDRFGLHNPARLVVGTSGAGKSYATKLEVCRWRVRGAEAVVVDPEGEFTRLGDVLQGLVLAVGEEPAGLDPVGLATRPGLAAAEGLAVLASVAAALLGGTLSAVDLALLDRALMVLRADVGHRATMSDLLDVLADISAHPPFTGADLAARLSPAASGSLAQLFAANPELDDPPPLVVFDFRSVPARARPAVMACVLAWTWDRATTGAVATPRLLVVDEAHLLLDDPAAADLLAQFARRARKYHLGVDVVTQRLADFLGNPAGQAVLANTATKLLLGCEDHDRAAVATGLGLTDAEADLLRAGRRGHGLLLTPTLRAAVRIVAHPAEHELASAGPRPR
jgi:hypothetical protein